MQRNAGRGRDVEAVEPGPSGGCAQSGSRTGCAAATLRLPCPTRSAMRAEGGMSRRSVCAARRQRPRSQSPSACNCSTQALRPTFAGKGHASAPNRRRRGSPCGTCGSQLVSSISTASAPKAAALRNIEPILSWLEMPQAASTRLFGRQRAMSASHAARSITPAERQHAAMHVETGNGIEHGGIGDIDGNVGRELVPGCR